MESHASSSFDASKATRLPHWATAALLLCALLWISPNVFLLRLSPTPENGVKLALSLSGLAMWSFSFRDLHRAALWALPFFVLWSPDLCYTLQFRAPPSTPVWATILTASLEEKLDFLRGKELRFLVTLALSLFIWGSVLVATRRVKDWRPPRLATYAARAAMAAFCLCVAALYVSPIRDMISHRPGRPSDSPILRTKGVFPFGRLVSIAEYYRDIISIRSALEERKSFRFGAEHRLDSAGKPQRYVLVIGETGRPDRWSLNGYERPTTPRLQALGGVVSLPNVVSTATLTTLAVPVMVSRMSGTSMSQAFEEPSVLSAFKEAGFKTYWVSLQVAFGQAESAISHFAYEADEVRFLSFSNSDLGVLPHDDALLQPLAELLARPEPKQFIVLHTLGSHDAYQRRYPAAFDVFQPSLATRPESRPNHHSVLLKEEVNNSYDNSILFTDYVLSRIAGMLDDPSSVAGMLYSADHGELLFDGECTSSGHGGNSYYEYPVATMAWTSGTYRLACSEKVETLLRNRAKPATIESLLPTMLDMAGIVLRGRTPEGSLMDAQYQPRARMVRNQGRAVDWDKSRFGGACRVLEQ